MSRPSASSPARFAQTATSRRTTTTSSADTAAAPIGHTAARTKPTRTTVDLSPSDHRRLRQLADRAAEVLDVPEVHRREVWLGLLAELADDDALFARVVERIRTAREG